MKTQDEINRFDKTSDLAGLLKKCLQEYRIMYICVFGTERIQVDTDRERKIK